LKSFNVHGAEVVKGEVAIKGIREVLALITLGFGDVEQPTDYLGFGPGGPPEGSGGRNNRRGIVGTYICKSMFSFNFVCPYFWGFGASQ
jgi:hypothetical protein